MWLLSLLWIVGLSVCSVDVVVRFDCLLGALLYCCFLGYATIWLCVWCALI